MPQAGLIILVLLGLQLLAAHSALAATIVSGKTGANERWVPERALHSHWRCACSQGATLTIAPGTEVRFRRYHTYHPYTNRGCCGFSAL